MNASLSGAAARSAPDGRWLAPGPVHTLHAGTLAMDIAPAAGGRIAALASVDAAGRRMDWLAPMPASCLRDGFDGLAWPKAGCYPLLPFSNRIRDGRFHWAGREIRLAPHPGQDHAMHGVAHARAWQVDALTAASAELSLHYVPVAGDWPWPFVATQRLVLTPDGLHAEMVLRNAGDSAMPAGGGFHPYFARTPGMRVQFEADTVWPVDAGEVATGRQPISRREDFREARPLPAESFSVYYSGWRQLADVRHASGAVLTLRADDPLDHFILHAPGGADYFCLEPVSHVSDAINLAAQGWDGTGLRVLAPGAELRLRMQLRLAPACA
ncbi:MULTISPECIES: aldose 1-epimerase [Ralstonia solanacearum species complex]|uniref:aldose 1-epimerase n=1 Tax=Ralstonia solanacearum species complex TaxID=3116862 RepID=UPI0019690060|nr:aldose 1-epimerase [Ralstonia solanacearum]